MGKFEVGKMVGTKRKVGHKCGECYKESDIVVLADDQAVLKRRSTIYEEYNFSI
jgi:hypothetical protein